MTSSETSTCCGYQIALLHRCPLELVLAPRLREKLDLLATTTHYLLSQNNTGRVILLTELAVRWIPYTGSVLIWLTTAVVNPIKPEHDPCPQLSQRQKLRQRLTAPRYKTSFSYLLYNQNILHSIY